MLTDNRLDLLRRYAAGFAGMMLLSDLRHAETRGIHNCYACPCGATDHYATAPLNYVTGPSTSLSPVLTCYFTGQQWYVFKDVQGIIAKEEAAFARIMDKAERDGMLGKRVTAKEAFDLYTSRGYPVELFEIDDAAAYDRLMDEHRERSRGKAGVGKATT